MAHPALRAVYEQLLTPASGKEIVLTDAVAAGYVVAGERVSGAEVARRATTRGEVLLGWQSGGDGLRRVELNLPPGKPRLWSPGDRVVVIGKRWHRGQKS